MGTTVTWKLSSSQWRKNTDKDKTGEMFQRLTAGSDAGVMHTDLLVDAVGVDVKDDHVFESGGDVSLGSLHQQGAIQTCGDKHGECQ